MKANQKFVRADEAVSPVIGVILMVAVTVVLAAVVFVLVNDLGAAEDSAPQLTFSKDEEANSLTLVKAPTGGLLWDAFVVGGSCTQPAAGETVDAGDVIACAAGLATISHIATNTLIYETTFA